MVEDVLPVVKQWASVLQLQKPGDDAERDRLLCEALWIQQSFHAVDSTLLGAVLTTKTPQARAAAVHVLTEERERILGAFDLLKKAATDDHPRVRTEAIRGLSFYGTTESIDALLAASKQPMDYWTKYTLDAALGANEELWRQPFITGKFTKEYPAGANVMDDVQIGRAHV